jgi:hypothetical protein
MKAMKRAAFVVVIAILAAACSKSTPNEPAPAPTALTITGSATFTETNQNAQLTATLRLSNGVTQDQTGSATWTSSNPTVATVSGGGFVTSVGHGTADISAAVQGFRDTVTARVTIACVVNNTAKVAFENRSSATVHDVIFDGSTLFRLVPGQRSPSSVAVAGVQHTMQFRDPDRRGGCTPATPIFVQCGDYLYWCTF